MADERDSAEALGQAGGDCRFGNVSGIGQGGDITGPTYFIDGGMLRQSGSY
jgi:hypothetical protein